MRGSGGALNFEPYSFWSGRKCSVCSGNAQNRNIPHPNELNSSFRLQRNAHEREHDYVKHRINAAHVSETSKDRSANAVSEIAIAHGVIAAPHGRGRRNFPKARDYSAKTNCRVVCTRFVGLAGYSVEWRILAVTAAQLVTKRKRKLEINQQWANETDH